MKPIDNSQTDNHIIRAQSTIYEDMLKIIAYPSFLLITWNILFSTRKLLVHLLGEEFDDLHIRVILYRCMRQQQMTEFLIIESSGVLRLEHVPTGTYVCEVIACNSHNETITIKRSNKLHYFQDDNNGREYKWEQLSEADQSWSHAFSGYTVYD
jgi:hypothetical protein